MIIHLTKSLRLLLSLGLAAAIATPAFAQSTYTRVDNTSTLDAAAAWSGATPPPTSIDIAQWNGVTTNVATGLAANVSWGEIQLTSLQTTPVTIGSGGTVTLNGVGGVGIDLSVSSTNLITSAGLNIAADQTWEIANGKSIQVNGVIAGSATPTVTVQGPGTLILNAANTQKLNVVLNGATLNFGGGCLTATGGFFGGGNNSVNGPGSLTLEGTPTFRVTSARIAAALNTSVQSNVIINNTARLLYETNNLDLDNATRTFTFTNTGNSTGGSGNVRLGFQIMSTANLYIPSMVITNGTLDLESTGVTLGNNIWVGFISATPFGGNALNGTLTTNNGLILGANIVTELGVANPFGTGSTAASLTINTNGMLDMSDQSTSSRNVEVFSLNGAGTITNKSTGTGTATLTISGSTNSSFTGVIKNGSTAFVALSKTGASLLSLSGVNTYTGATTISGGTLAVVSSGSVTGSAISINSGGTLAGNSTVGTVSLGSNATISPGSGVLGNVGTLTTGALTLGANGTYALDLNNTGSGTAGTDWDQIITTTTTFTANSTTGSTLLINLNSTGAGSWNPNVSTAWDNIITSTSLPGYASNIFTFVTTGFNGANPADFSIVPDSGTPTNLDLVYTAVPEPATWGLLVGAVAVLAARRRRA